MQQLVLVFLVLGICALIFYLFIYLFILVMMLIKEKDQQRDLAFYQGLILLLECSDFCFRFV